VSSTYRKDVKTKTERRPVQFCRSIEPVTLYLDDIEQIVAYLLDISPDADLVLATPKHEVTTVEGLSRLDRPEIPAIEIRCSVNPRRLCDFVVSIEPQSVFLCRAGDTLAHRRAFSQIEALLLARHRGRQWQDWLLGVASVLGPVAGVVFVLAQSGAPAWLPYGGAALAGISLSLSALLLLTKQWRASRVLLIKRQDHRVRWESITGAAIIVALISMMALVTLGFALLYRSWSAR
jgi:hypothetical protein